jgi:hypothetical protein
MKHIRGHLRLIVLGHEVTYFVEHKTKIKMCYAEREVICMLEFLYRSITYLSSSKVTFSNKSSELLWEQTVPLSMSIFTFTPTLVDLFLCPCIKRNKSNKNNYLELDNKEMKFEEIRFVTKSLQCFKYIIIF